MTGSIVFDLDGTLIDSALDIQSIANAALAGVGAEPISLAETHSFIGEGIHVFIGKMRVARGLPANLEQRLLEDVTARYDDAVTLTEMYPGARSALDRLSEKYRLGICTNKLHRPCLAVLRHLRIDHHFSSIWGGDNPFARKPDPAALLAAFDELGVGPRLYVGDSEIDAETAERAGVSFFLFTKGYRKSPVEQIAHKVAFEDFNDLPALVAEHFAE